METLTTDTWNIERSTEARKAFVAERLAALASVDLDI